MDRLSIAQQLYDAMEPDYGPEVLNAMYPAKWRGQQVNPLVRCHHGDPVEVLAVWMYAWPKDAYEEVMVDVFHIFTQAELDDLKAQFYTAPSDRIEWTAPEKDDDY